MSTINGSNLSSLLTSARRSYAAYEVPSLVQILEEDTNKSSSGSPSTIVSLSDEAKTYLASSAQSPTNGPSSSTSIATGARDWLDQQYEKLSITSPRINGQIAIGFTGQDRSALAAIASNAQGLFRKDEIDTAKSILQSRFDDAMSPHVVIARHTGNYAGLYDAALAYLNEAGANERATSTWQAQYKALTEGAAAGRRNPGKVPDTGNANDVVRALLDEATEAPSPDSGADVIERARALLDKQINSAKDSGTELVFDKRRRVGQQANFSQFDNRMLAEVALNQDTKFSVEEARAAKAELNSRTRLRLLEALNSGSGSDASAGSLAMIKQYATMSAEEKAVLGVTEPLMNRLVQNHQSLLSVQNALSRNTGISAYL